MGKTTTIFSDFVYEDKNEELAWELLPACQQLLRQCKADNRYLKGLTTYYSDNVKVQDFREWEYPVFDKFYEYILSNIQEYMKIMSIHTFTIPKLTHVWISEMNEGGSHEFHVHNNSWISGNYYVKAPISSAHLVFQRPNFEFDRWSGNMYEQHKPINHTEFNFSAEVGKLLMWKSILKHGVRHNYSNNRIAISFNVDLVR
jgi:uncharacterized protein (TIGR02466 family)